MSAIVVFAIIIIALFTLSFMTGRRFGMLGLALAAGSVLGDVMGYNFGIAASIAGVPSDSVSQALVSSFLILLPAGLLLFKGNAYKSVIGRVVGAALFSLLATAFLIAPFGPSLAFSGYAREAYVFVSTNSQVIIGFGIIFAVMDLLLTKVIKVKEKSK